MWLVVYCCLDYWCLHNAFPVCFSVLNTVASVQRWCRCIMPQTLCILIANPNQLPNLTDPCVSCLFQCFEFECVRYQNTAPEPSSWKRGAVCVRDQVSERMEQILHNENWSSRIQGASAASLCHCLQLIICSLVLGATLSHSRVREFLWFED